MGFFDTELVVLCSCDCLGRAICGILEYPALWRAPALVTDSCA